ncbi:MAG: bifunctional alpha/beta hydrolase/class I SAM-dependent methyltransferase [Bryobacteraceae bacterium]
MIASGIRTSTEHSFLSWDGVELFYRAWLSDSPKQKALILFHRGHEHSGRFQDTVDLLDLEDFSIFAWDARGHGRSPGERGYAETFGCLVRDADAFVKHICSHYRIPLENAGILAVSVGAVVVSAWVHDYAPPIRVLVLGSPALRVKLYVPFALFFLRLQLMVQGKAFVQSYVKAKMLTHDAQECENYANDKLITRSIAVNILIGMHDTATRLLADAGAILPPTLVLTSGKDWVVKLAPQREFFSKLPSPQKQIQEYPGYFHDLFHELGRHDPIAKSREFILQSFASPHIPISLAKGERNRAEFEKLSAPLSPLSPMGLFWGAQRLFLKTIGKLSKGVQIGWRYGFDSGESLDHVYTNKPQGITSLGKLIDTVYLGSPGWKGIRQRKINLKALLRRAIERVHEAGEPVHLLDVAAGGGRYVLETMRELAAIPMSAQLRDWSSSNVESIARLADEFGLANVSVMKADAFDRQSLAAIAHRPSIAIVSGLYELFPDNRTVARSLLGISEAVMDGGYLIYTNQPWHPQLEMIARVLDNREGKPWVMRCRAQAEMDELVRAAGFTKLDMLIDEQGIFTVSLARRRNHD